MCERGATCVSEASCPNFEPRAHARLTGLTNRHRFARAAPAPRFKESWTIQRIVDVHRPSTKNVI